MNAKKHRIAELTVVGLSIALLTLILLPEAASYAGSDAQNNSPPDHASIRVSPMMPMPTSANPYSRLAPHPAHDTFIIQVQTASPELMRALANLQTAGQIAALDVGSAPDRIFVLGDSTAVLALRELPGVVAVYRADEQGPPVVEQMPPPRPHPSDETVEPNPAANLTEHNSPVPVNPQRIGEEAESIQESTAPLTAPVPESVPAKPEQLQPLAHLPGLPLPRTTTELAPRSIQADGYITGLVTADDGGAPLASVGISLYEPVSYVYRYASTDANGVYSTSVPPGSYQVAFEPDDYHINEYYDDVSYETSQDYTPVVVGDGETVTNINASLAPGVQISGRVTDQVTAGALANIDIYVSHTGSNYYAWSSTNTSGAYTTTPGLPAGSYQVRFQDYSGLYATEYYSHAFRPSLATSVELTSTHRDGIDAALSEASAITGTVTGDGPLSGIWVTAYYADEYSYVGQDDTDAAGHFRLAGLGPIAYKLTFYDGSGVYLSEWYQGKTNWDTADPITLTSGTTTTIEVQLTKTSTISGTVTAEGSGIPLANISVTAYDAATDNYVRSRDTDASGVYRIDGLTAGDYKLGFYDNNGDYLREYYDNKPNLDSADSIPVTAGMTSTVSVQLIPAGVIDGEVTTQGSGTPLSNIDVNVYNAANDSFVTDSDTDASGAYRIGGLAEGNYKLYFYDNNGDYLEKWYDDKPNLSNADPISVTSGMTSTIDVQLVQAGVISGTVTAENGGTPLENINVTAYDGTTGSYVNAASTNISGTYRIGGLAEASYKLRFYDGNGGYILEYYDDQPDMNSADLVTVTAGVTVTANAQLTQAGNISGTVTDESDDSPLTSIGIEVRDASTHDFITSGSTDTSGVYHIGGLIAGTYKLFFYHYSGDYLSEYYDDKPNLDSADPITVTGGAMSTVNAQLTRAGVVNGVVTVEGSGAPLNSIRVRAYDAASGNQINSDTTGASGTYRIGGLATGNYKLRFSDNNGNYLLEYYEDKPNLDSADPISVTGGMTTTIDAQLVLGSVFSGTITAEDTGMPLNNVSVTAYDAASGSYIRSHTTDASGVYRISGLAAGEYKLRFYDNEGLYLAEYYEDKADSNSADPVSLTVGITMTLNAQLTRAGIVQGTVTAEGSGVPLNNVQVRIYSAATGGSLDSDSTDASGAYRIGGLATGSYKLRFYDNNGMYITEYYDDQANLDHADLITVTAGMTTTIDAQLTQGGIVRGTVTAEGSGTLLNNVRVTLYEANTGDYITQDTTDASGLYHIGGLKSNAYKLRFEDNSGQYLLEWHQDKLTQATADTIMITGGMTSTVDAVLAAGARVTGRVTGADSGTGIANVYVETVRQDDASPNGWANTDANGYYTTSAMYSGVYRVQFSAPQPYYSEYYDNFKWNYGFTLITVTAPLTKTGINAALDRGNLISGTVTADAAAISGVNVRAYLGDNTYSSYSANTGSDGIYRLGPLDSGQYRVRFAPSGLYAIEWYSDSASYTGSTPFNLNGDLGNINADLTEGGRITGTVTGSGGVPLADLWVYVYPAGNDNSIVSIKTDADGHYATENGLATGQYQVQFSAPLGYQSEWYNNQASQTSATLVSVMAGETHGDVNAQLATYAWSTVTGTVTTADTGLPVNMWVYAYSVSGLGSWSAYANGGHYVLRGLPPDAYRISFSSPPSPYVPIYYHDQPDWDLADLITVTAGMTMTNINQALLRGGTITGTVSSASDGVPGVYVYATRIGGSSWTRTSYTGLEGHYRLEGLTAGEYKVQFSPPSPFVGEWYNDAPDKNSASSVTVTLGAITPDINVTLDTGGIITGFITAAGTGDPLPGAYVNVYSTTGTSVRGSIYADTDGYYQTPGLPADEYHVFFDEGPWRYYRSEWYADASSQSTALTVTVPASGSVPDINASLEQGGSISGWTYNALKGLPVESVYVRIYDAVTGFYIGYDYSNNGGLYQVNALASGLYKAAFSRSGFKEQWYNQALNSDSALTITVSAPDEVYDINAYLRYANEVYLPLVLRQSP